MRFTVCGRRLVLDDDGYIFQVIIEDDQGADDQGHIQGGFNKDPYGIMVIVIIPA